MNSIVEFDFEKSYVLENEYVQLRPLTLEDRPNLLPFSLQEPNIWKYSLITAAGEAALDNYLDTAVKARLEKKEYPFIVLDKRTNEYAGSTRFYDVQLAFQTLQLGYTWYGQKFQGTGLNKHCKFLLLSFAFDQLAMERVEFRADNNNERSIAAMKSIGCKVDGILRSQMPNREGDRRDTIVLSILKDEWQDEVKEKLLSKLLIH